MTYFFYSIHFFFINDPAPTDIYTLSLHDALPIYLNQRFAEGFRRALRSHNPKVAGSNRSEEHTSELQSPYDLVCRRLLEKTKKSYSRPEGGYCRNTRRDDDKIKKQ